MNKRQALAIIELLADCYTVANAPEPEPAPRPNAEEFKARVKANTSEKVS